MDFRPLPSEYRELYSATRPKILATLEEFANVPQRAWFYELAFCLLTPQSKAIHANAVVARLKEGDFQSTGFDPTALLRDKDHYIRFHNVKARRLLEMRNQWPSIENLLVSELPVRQKRDDLNSLVTGVGMKEASHVMRNIGFSGLAIIDRHIITGLVACGVYVKVPALSSRKSYHEIEQRFLDYADYVRINPDELDLLFWSKVTGFVLK